MNELKLENLKKISGGEGSCGRDKGSSTSSGGGKKSSSSSCGSNAS